MDQKPSDELLSLVMYIAREAKRRIPDLVKRVCVLHRDLRVVRLRDQAKVRDAIQLLIQRDELKPDLDMNICAAEPMTASHDA